jgi:hypothetical protein
LQCDEIFYVLSAVWRSEIYCSYNLLLPMVLLVMANAGGLTVLAVYMHAGIGLRSWRHARTVSTR